MHYRQFSSDLRRGATAIALTVVIIGLLAAIVLRGFPKGAAPTAGPIDFMAFYSAARVAAIGRDPYLSEPLRARERDALAESGLKMVPNLVVPAPLPPYALALFAPLSFLSFRWASAVWFSAALVAISITIVLLRRSTGAPLLAIVPAIVLADGLASLLIGQIVPLVLCAVAAAGYALERGRPKLAAILILATACEPHIGLGGIAALFIWEPRARRILVAGAVALLILSLSFGGIARNLEYFTVVLPAQALSEGLEFGGQYNLSALLVALGTSSGVALAFGTVWYSAMLIAGARFARKVSIALGHRSAVVFFPTALTVFGGVYVHVHQIAFALPLLFLVVARGGRVSKIAMIALLLLAVPWETLEEFGFGARHVAVQRVDVKAELAGVSAPGLVANVVWGVWVRSGARDGRTRQERFYCKTPTWLGLVVLMALTACCVVTRRSLVAVR